MKASEAKELTLKSSEPETTLILHEIEKACKNGLFHLFVGDVPAPGVVASLKKLEYRVCLLSIQGVDSCIVEWGVVSTKLIEFETE